MSGTEARPNRELSHRRDQAQGVEVFAIESGPDPTAISASPPRKAGPVLVHGLAVSNRYLVPCLRALATDRRVFARPT